MPPPNVNPPTPVVEMNPLGVASPKGEVDHSTHPFGLATPSGFISTTGVGGSFVTANTQEQADLFWAVRGGGGNFGVVTSFLFQLHPLSTVYGGPIFWPLEQAEVLFK